MTDVPYMVGRTDLGEVLDMTTISQATTRRDTYKLAAGTRVPDLSMNPTMLDFVIEIMIRRKYKARIESTSTTVTLHMT